MKIKLEEKESCVAKDISWGRLQDVFRQCGQMRPDEVITHLEIHDWGIRHYTEGKQS